MTFETWEAIARRQLWYRTLLAAKMAEWPESRVDACTDMLALQRVINLTRRVELHRTRMDRWIDYAERKVKAAGGYR